MTKIKEKYSKRERIHLKNVEKSPFGQIRELQSYDEILNKKIEDINYDEENESRAGGPHYVNVKFVGIKYPFIYKHLKYGFNISKLIDINIWMKNYKEELIYKDFNLIFKVYKYDYQITEKHKLMKKYFKLISFELINKFSLEEYNKLLNNTIFVSNKKILKQLQFQIKKIEENTKILDNSYFKDLIYSKLDNESIMDNRNQKVKK